jgi:hypothetical protein
MEAILRRNANVHFELFTTCPPQLFKASIGDDFGYHAVQPDIGVIQLSPLKEDLQATCDQLDKMLPYNKKLIHSLAEQLKGLNCCMVICDIAPLGIEVANKAGLPSILIENFTWDWIYRGYLNEERRLAPHIAYLEGLFHRADHHIQTQPICKATREAVTMKPMYRNTRSDRRQIRRQLGIPYESPMVLVSMGGVPDRFQFLSKVPSNLHVYFVISGANGRRSPHDRVLLLPKHSNFFHPDLMAAADALIGKAGYSTVAEAYQTGIPFGYIERPQSPESPVLEAFIRRHLPCTAIAMETYDNGQWIEHVPQLLAIPRSRPRTRNGADDVAGYILKQSAANVCLP